MKRFLLLYEGPPTPPEASHEGWPEWFRAIGDALVDLGSPMVNGLVLDADGSTSGDAAGFNGYSVIQAEGRSEALDLLRDHPLLALAASTPSKCSKCRGGKAPSPARMPARRHLGHRRHLGPGRIYRYRPGGERT